MKNLYTVARRMTCMLICTVSLLVTVSTASAQKATVAIPVAIGTSCGASGSTKDSVKYFNYSSTTNILNKRFLCQPSLAAPGFSENLATTTFNPYDGYLYFMQIALVSGIYNTYAYKWLPTTCPVASQAVTLPFLNQFVAGVEFDPATGLGYQINFVDTTGWAPDKIDATGAIGQYVSHAVVNGNPAISYYDATNGDLKYIRANENSGTSWATPVTVTSAGTVGQYTSLLTVNGNPAIAYYDVAAGDLKYVRATNATGTAWGAPISLETVNNIGQFTSLAIVNGNPAVAYYDVTNGDLRYIRATDASGTAWGAAMIVDGTGNTGQYASLIVVNGNPAISYYDVTNTDLKYIRATNATGSAWGAAVSAEASGNNIGQYTSLAIVNGNPAISYYDVSNGDLRYVQSSDVNGAAWAAPVNITSTGSNVGQYTTLQIVNGNPGVSYYDVSGGDLKFVRATNVNGSAWGAAVSVETGNNVGQFASMIIANGNPAIAYYDATNSDLRFVRSYDNNGTLWYKNSGIYNMELQQVNFTTGALNNSYPIDFGGRHIYKQTGDMVMTPNGNLLAVYNNKYFKVNWKDYSTAIPLVATYIDTVILGAGNDLVGLSYSDGKLVGSISTAACPNYYRQLDILTGAMSNITYGDGGTIFNSTDMTNISSGVGAAKRLVSATENPVGSKTYDIVYELILKNYGNTPVTNVQAYDTLNMINGIGNVISGSITSFSAPGLITQNALYNGKTIFSLLTPGGTLSNIPGQNTITLQISCKISNINVGIVYNNQAFITGTGLLGDALRDSSTNGAEPDLNLNDKPDDIGESQPTPLLIAITPQTPPCSALTNVLYAQDFGTGTGLTNVIPAAVLGSGVSLGTATTSYANSVTQPIPNETYTITNQSNNANTLRFLSLTDHTGNANGRMMIVNADASSTIMYRASFTKTLCANQEYSLSFYATFVGNASYQTVCNAFGGFVYPKIKMRVLDGSTGLIISQVSTADITNTAWQQYGFKFVTPSSFTSIIIELSNDAPGGCGNDIAIDDIQFGTCDALPTVSVAGSAGCLGSSTSFNSALTDPGAISGTIAYQWQVASALAGPYSDIPGATSAIYTIPSLAAADTGKYYRLIVAAAGNIGTPGCQYTSPGIILSGLVPSTAPASVSASAGTICSGGSTTLTAVGGALGTGANYQWGTGAVVGTSPIVGATSSTLTISPSSTTTYWVQIQNTTAPCSASSAGVTRVVTVNQPSVAPSSVTGPNVCNGGSTTLTAVGGSLGSGANYQWGTGAVVGTSPIAGATGSTLTVSPSSTTTYWVQIQNTTAPCTATTSGLTKVITVNQPSTAPSSVTGPDICNGGSTTLTAVGGALGTGANYQWGTGAVVGTSPIAGATSSTLTVSPSSTTTYWVQIQNTTSPCTATTSGLTKVITVNQPSVAPSSVTGPDICNGGSTTLTAVGGALGTGANYQWGTGAVVGTSPIAGATGSTLTVSPSSTTTYWVQIQNTTSPCTAATSGLTKVITVNQPSTAPSSVTGPDICNGGSTTLTAVGGALGTGANYQWGTGAVVGTSPIAGATSSTLTVSPSSTTTYWVQIQNTTSPCTAATSGLTKLITVTQPSVAPSSVTGANVCNGGSTTLTAVGGALGTGANYQWGTGAVVGTSPIAGATGSTLTVSPSSTTTYWVQIQNTTSPCTAATSGLTKVITVNQPSVAPSSVTGVDICNGGSTTLTAIGGSLGTGANYQWGTGAVVGTSPIAGATGSTLTVSPSSTTTYWVQIQNATAPCSATTSGLTKLITVSQLSVAATGATKNKNNICPGISVGLGITGGSLGTAASWKWYTGSAGGTLVGTGTTLTVTPLVTTTYYVRAEGSCNNTADQSVTVFISCDIDKDKDGIADFVESNMSAAFADANANGVSNAYDPTYAGFVDNNNDYINDNFQADGDSDNDGIPNYLDTTFPGRVDSNGDGVDDRFDADKDGIINMLDLDSDNDGIPDVVEAYGVDANGDGKIDSFTDTDGDGLSQNVDVNNTGAYNTGLGLGNIDFDGDGVPNFVDLDSDNDGIPDVVESGGPDTNNDGKIDGFADANLDGLHDGYINATALLKTGADVNADGKADSYPNKNLDQDFRSNAYDIDSDGDGIVDVIEAGLPDANLDGKADGVIGTNGWSGTISAMVALNLRNTDGSGNPDYLDIDSDNDGIPDNIEAQPTATYKTPTLVDGDGDGLATIYDNVPGAFGGSGIFVWDQDGDGIPDYRDLDTDGDGQPDIAEGNDFNLNGIADDLITLTGLDTDGDGLDNRFDSLNSTTNLKGTSYMMGTNGSTVGDATPGSRCPVQKKTPTQADRDWRFVGTVLPVQFLNFGGIALNNQVALNWTIVATKDIDHFEIERSTDNISYAKVGIVTDAVKLNVQQSFGYPDDINSVTSDIIYYRLKVIGKAGEIKYSNVLVVRKNQVKTPVTIMPNPAQEFVAVRFLEEKESEVTIRLVDNLGKIVLLQKQKVLKGSNMIQLNGLTKYSSGVYTVQVLVNDEIVTKKLIIGK
jgi:hypothetical protein